MSLEKLAKLVDAYAGLVARAAMNVNAAMKEADRVEPIMKKYIQSPSSYDEMMPVYDEGREIMAALNTHQSLSPQDPVVFRRAQFDKTLKSFYKTLQIAKGMARGDEGAARKKITEAEKKKLGYAVLNAMKQVGYKHDLLAGAEFPMKKNAQGDVVLTAIYFISKDYPSLEKFQAAADQALKSIIQADTEFPVRKVTVAYKYG